MQHAGAHSLNSGAVAPALVSLRMKLGYGFGAIAYGIKDNGFAVFLLLYFNQVVGMPASQVGLAILIALIADAVFDPLVGHLSDQTRSRWGRRHPWLYASVIPIVISWLLLWNPPQAQSGMQFIYLLALAMCVRFSFSAYEVPTLAMLPELTKDYHDRTEVLRYRFLFGWGGGLVMLYLAYAVLLLPEPGYPVGQLNPNGYQRYAVVGAGIMCVAVLVSALSTHARIARPSTGADASPHIGLAETLNILSFKPFLILLLAGVCAFANQGLVFALTNYLLLFVWGFEQATFNLYPLTLFVGVVLAFLIVGPISRRFDKAKSAAVLSVLALTVGTLPYWLRALDLLSANGSKQMLVTVLAMISLSTGFAICTMILITSMMADVTDASEARTGRRTEGLFFAGFFFMQKCVGGIGIMVSALILTGIGFPDGAVPGQVPQTVIDNLALVFASSVAVIGFVCAYFFYIFPLGKDDHKARLAVLPTQ